MGGKRDFLVMYHGAVVPGRDIERVVELVFINPNVKAVILGNSTKEYRQELQNLTIEYDVTDRILFHQAVPLTDLWKYVGAVDVGLILARATCRNHLYSLPNKFFENIQAETPVVCPNYPAFRGVVERYGNGILCDPESIESINECVENLRTDKVLYNKIKDNARRAKDELNWNREKESLRQSYLKII